MRRLIKSSGSRMNSRARTHARMRTHTPILNPHARINTQARLVYTWPLGRGVHTVSQRSSSVSYHAAFPCYSLSRTASRTPYLSSSPRYDTDRGSRSRNSALFHRTDRDATRWRRASPGIASREAARKWQFALDRAKCLAASRDALGIITRERETPRVVDLVERNARCVYPIGERDVVQVLQGILRRAQAGAEAGECFVLLRVYWHSEKSGDLESINPLREPFLSMRQNC